MGISGSPFLWTSYHLGIIASNLLYFVVFIAALLVININIFSMGYMLHDMCNRNMHWVFSGTCCVIVLSGSGYW